jgi:hypothetical protein
MEEPHDLAGRLARFLTSLAGIDPVFGRWQRYGMRHRSIVPLHITLPPSVPELRDWIKENPFFVTHHGRKHLEGYSTSAGTPDTERPNAVLRVRVMRADAAMNYGNKIALSIDLPDKDPWSLCQAARPIMLALATAWDAAWVAVDTCDCGRQSSQSHELISQPYRGGWMIYLDQGLASRMASQDAIEIESLPDGAILMRVSDDPFFYYDDGRHYVAARHIQAALAPLGAGPLELL